MTLQRTTPRTIAGISTLLLTVGLLSACTPEPEPTPTPTAAFASEEEAFAAAEEVYRAYIDASNAVEYADPSTFEPVLSYTTGDYQTSEREELSEMHAEGFVRGGAIEIVSFTPEAFDDKTVTATACNDVSNTTFTDENGVSLISPDRPNRVALTLSLKAVKGSLLIDKAEAIEAESCVSG